MKIVGLDSIIFGVDDIAACATFLTDYGLIPVNVTADGGRFEALDGTSVVLMPSSDTTLPPGPNGCKMRKTVMGVADAATLDAIAAELGKDRAVIQLADGSLESTDDSGFVIGFQITVRKPLPLAGEIANVPGAPIQRPVNHRAVKPELGAIHPRTLSHIVYYVPNPVEAEAFYVERLGFRCTDRFEGAGPFLQPAGCLDHHTHFLIATPPFMKGVEHFTFHFAGPTEVIQNGTRFVEKGYQPFWGPGRHIFGSNWFWYFNSPFGCHIEMDADMDLHDHNWQPRVAPLGADSSQVFLLRFSQKWSPGKDTPENGNYQ